MFTMFSGRFNLTLQVVDQVKKYFGTKVYKTTIPRTIRISAAPSYGQPINFYEPKGKGSEEMCIRDSRQRGSARPTRQSG